MEIKQPRWKLPEYTKKQINNAGDVIRDDNSNSDEKSDALNILDNWRSAHAYPLHVFYINLRNRAGKKPGVIVAERLKRRESIVDKLKRESGMKLYRMQDIGGCRMILPSLSDMYKYSRDFQTSKIRHELKKVNDYISNPKTSGYRSLHLVYRFKTGSKDKDIFNQYPMLIELQFRTHLQHLWATALETIGFFTNEALKAGRGSQEILRFFVLISSLFAIKEGTPVVPGTIDDENELVSEMEMINENHHVLDKLRAIRMIIDHDGDNIPDKRGYYILQLNYETSSLRRWFFKPSELEAANKLYDTLERNRGEKPLDIVLVRASSYGAVKDAYPNYFLDIGEFLELVEGYLK